MEPFNKLFFIDKRKKMVAELKLTKGTQEEVEGLEWEEKE